MPSKVVLGVESSCDETGVGIVRVTYGDGAEPRLEILADQVASSMEQHARFGGVVPEIASRAHLESMGPVMRAALAEAGAKVAFNERSADKLEKGSAAYKEAGLDVRPYLCDVTDEADVKSTVKKINADLGVIDILVNNAGIIRRVPMTELTVEQYKEVIDIDLVSPFIAAKAVVPQMIEKGHGKIINICSMMSELGRETVSAYAAAKGGLKMLTRNICSEYGKYNIQCNGIGPGYIATSQTAPLREKQADGSRHPFDSFIISKTPAERWGTPDDLKGPAVFLASDASDFVNGHILYVDGGILAYIGRQPS